MRRGTRQVVISGLHAEHLCFRNETNLNIGQHVLLNRANALTKTLLHRVSDVVIMKNLHLLSVFLKCSECWKQTQLNVTKAAAKRI